MTHFAALFSLDFAGWATALAELVIAFVLWWELEENRRNSFLTEASDEKMYEARREIYSVFFDIDGECIQDKSAKFCERIWEDDGLRAKCERQILFFSRLGQIYHYAFFRRGLYVSLFPHTVINFWVMLQPFIEERRRLSGKWWATGFIELTGECLRFVLKNPEASLNLYDHNRKRKLELIIPASYLRQLQGELMSPRQKKASG